MNSLKVNEIVYKFQDMVEQKKVKTFMKFQNEIYSNFIIFDKKHKSYKFISYELKKMHAFLDEIQHSPNSHLLAQALKPMFRMLVDSIIIPKIVFVLNERSGQVVRIKYADLILVSIGRRLIQKTCNSFIVPFKGKPITSEVQLMNAIKLINSSWIALFVIEMLVERIKASPVFLDEFRRIARGDLIAYNQLMDRVMEDYLETD